MKTKTKKNPKDPKDPRIDKYIQEAPAFARPIFKHLRKLVHENCPEAEETLKWGAPWFMYNNKVLCGLVTFKAHCAFLFNKGSHLVDAEEKPAKAITKQLRHLTVIADLPSARVLKSCVKQAMKFNEPDGAKLIKRPPRTKKPPVKAPADLLQALRMNRKASATYEEFSESNKRHYVDWIMDAKTEATREKRLEKSVECLALGKTRHWE